MGAVTVSLLSAACGAIGGNKPDGGSGGGTGGGGGGSTGGGSATYVTGQAGVDVYNTQVCPNVAGAMCELMIRCGQMEANASCKVWMNQYAGGAGCDPQDLVALKNERAEVDQSRVASCMSAIQTKAGCSVLSGGDPTNELAECKDIVRGRVAVGGTCYTNRDCTPGNFCSSSSSTCPGTCAAYKAIGAAAQNDSECGPGNYVYDGKCAAHVALGSSCATTGSANTTQTCVGGAYCSASNVCTAVATSGQACAGGPAAIPCATGLKCVTASGSSAGTCKPLAGLQGTCALFNVPQPGCKYDLYCDQTSPSTAGVCKTLEPSGGACLFDISCQPGLVCQGESMSTFTKGTCAARKTAGQTCSGTGGVFSSDCVSGTYCAGTCQATKANGATCTTGAECQTGNCPSGVCADYGCKAPAP